MTDIQPLIRINVNNNMIIPMQWLLLHFHAVLQNLEKYLMKRKKGKRMEISPDGEFAAD